MHEHSKDHETAPTGADLLRQSASEGDRKFWSGQRPLSVVQWIGVVLLYLGAGVVVAQFGHPAYILASLAVVSALIAIGNRRARRKS